MVCCPPSEFVGEAFGWMDGVSEGVSEFSFQLWKTFGHLLHFQGHGR